MENRIDAVLSDEDRDFVLNHINQIRTKLPFLIDLTIEERKSLPKLGDKSRAFATQALALAEQDDSFLPRSFDKTEMRTDYALVNQLFPILMSMAQLTEMVEDTYTLAGSDVYSASLVVYQSAKNNGKGEALDSLVDTLGQRFIRKAKNKNTDKNTDTTEKDKPDEEPKS